MASSWILFLLRLSLRIFVVRFLSAAATSIREARARVWSYVLVCAWHMTSKTELGQAVRQRVPRASAGSARAAAGCCAAMPCSSRLGHRLMLACGVPPLQHLWPLLPTSPRNTEIDILQIKNTSANDLDDTE